MRETHARPLASNSRTLAFQRSFRLASAVLKLHLSTVVITRREPREGRSKSSNSKTYEKAGKERESIYPHRAAGRDCHYCNPGRHAPARPGESAGKGPSHLLR